MVARGPSAARLIVGLALTLLAVQLGGGPVWAQTRRALIIGIDDYNAAGPRREGARGPEREALADLEGAVHDARAFRALLETRFGFEPANVRLLLNAEATREGILEAFRSHLIKACAPGDTAVFYFAGHGSRIRNSSSSSPNQLDSTLVPADTAAGVRDIWDKELRLLFAELLATGDLAVRAFFDSCHSGSVTRGAAGARTVPWDPREAAEVYPGVHGAGVPTPGELGAVVFGACLDWQMAREPVGPDGQKRGLFSRALQEVLSAVPLDEPAQRVFLRLEARMRASGYLQDPTLDGVAPGELGPPLFGESTGSATGGLALAVVSLLPDTGEVHLRGGSAVGLAVGCELEGPVLADGTRVRLVVSEVTGLSDSLARVAAGRPEDITPGQDLFEVSAWVAPTGAQLALWLPPAPRDASAWRADLAAAAELQELGWGSWVEDPLEERPSHVLAYEGGAWGLRAWGGEPRVLGARLELARVLAALDVAVEEVALLLELPPAPDLGPRLALDRERVRAELVADPAAAQYHLRGRLLRDKIAYRWVLADLARRDVESRELHSALPLAGAWTGWREPREGSDPSARSLRERAFELARVRAWLTLEAPPDSGRFPYRLGIFLDDDGGAHDLEGGVALAGQRLRFSLLADPSQRTRAGRFKTAESRYIYLFVIDSRGGSTLVYPRSEEDSSDNRYPPLGSDPRDLPERFDLPVDPGDGVGPPFGLDTFVLLTTATPLSDPWAMQWEALRRGADQAAGSDPDNPLVPLFERLSGITRAPSRPVPTSWSIHRVQLESRAPK